MKKSNLIVKRDDLVYPELSYRLVGCAFKIFNELGGGHAEKYYQRAFATLLEQEKIIFKEQAYSPLIFQSKVIGRSFFDFLIEDKIIVEIKKSNYFSKANIDQLLQYLKTSHLQLGILINFGNDRVYTKRILNIEQ
jgi:GxxExxY protein